MSHTSPTLRVLQQYHDEKPPHEIRHFRDGFPGCFTIPMPREAMGGSRTKSSESAMLKLQQVQQLGVGRALQNLWTSEHLNQALRKFEHLHRFPGKRPTGCRDRETQLESLPPCAAPQDELQQQVAIKGCQESASKTYLGQKVHQNIQTQPQVDQQKSCTTAAGWTQCAESRCNLKAATGKSQTNLMYTRQDLLKQLTERHLRETK